MKLTFDVAATCNQLVRLWLVDDHSNQIALVGNLAEGKDTVEMRGMVHKDLSGTFTVNPSLATPRFDPCDGYSVIRNFTLPAITLHVTGIPDKNSHPGRADVSLSLTQQQFLDTKVADLKRLSGEIDTRVDADGHDSQSLRIFLVGIVQRAANELSATQQQYQKQILKSGEALPPFFADFSKQYSDLLVELRAPIPGTRVSQSTQGRLVLVQQTLKPRAPAKDDPIRSGNLSGTSPAIAKAVRSTVSDNAVAYQRARSNAHPTFRVTFESTPDGAILYYRQAIIPDFEVWSKPTNIPDAELPLATYVFKFEKEGCIDKPVRTVNPYYDTKPDVSVEFKRCQRR